MGKIIRLISEATPTISNRFTAIGCEFLRKAPYSTFVARGVGPGEGRTQETGVKVIGADHPREFNSTWPVEPLSVTRTREFVAK